MSRSSFETSVESGERGRVFITIPFDPSEEWGKKSRHYVTGTINGTGFSGSLGSRGGAYFMPLNKELQRSTGLAPGDTVAVVMEPAEAPGKDLPEDMESALAAAPDAAEFFLGLSAFYRNQDVAWIESAKKEETRQARIREAIELLKGGRKQR